MASSTLCLPVCSPPPDQATSAARSSRKRPHAALDTDVERAALKKYDAALVLPSATGVWVPRDPGPCASAAGAGGGYRDEQIRQVQTNRR